MECGKNVEQWDEVIDAGHLDFAPTALSPSKFAKAPP